METETMTAQVGLYARQRDPRYATSGYYSGGPFSSLKEIQERLATGIPLSSFEFQRIYSNLNRMEGPIRGAMFKVGVEGMNPDDLERLKLINELQAEALKLRPREKGKQGGMSPTELHIHRHKQSVGHRLKT